jgi:hypothetical protein
MNDPIYIQIDDLVREATPEEAEAIHQAQAESPQQIGDTDGTQ